MQQVYSSISLKCNNKTGDHVTLFQLAVYQAVGGQPICACDCYNMYASLQIQYLSNLYLAH